MKNTRIQTSGFIIILCVACVFSNSFALNIDSIASDASPLGKLQAYVSTHSFTGHISNIIDDQYGAGGSIGFGSSNIMLAMDFGIGFGKTTGSNNYNDQAFDGKRNAISTSATIEFSKVIPLRYLLLTPSIGAGIQGYDINLQKGDMESNYEFSSGEYHFGLEFGLPVSIHQDALNCITIRADYAPSIDQRNSGARLTAKIGYEIIGWMKRK